MMQDARFQFATNQSCTASGVATNSVPLDAVLNALGSGRPVYIEVQITETLNVANTGTDHNSVRFEAVLIDEASAALAAGSQQVLGRTCEVHDLSQATIGLTPVGRAAAAASGTAPAGSVRGLFTIALNPMTVEQVESIRSVALLGVVMNRIKLFHTVTNYAGAGLTAGKYSATLVFDAKSTLSVEQFADAVN